MEIFYEEILEFFFFKLMRNWIYWNDELLEYEQPETRLLEDGPVRSTIELPVKIRGKKQQTVIVKGEIYVLQTMSHTHSGIQLFHNPSDDNWRKWEFLMIIGARPNF